MSKRHSPRSSAAIVSPVALAQEQTAAQPDTTPPAPPEPDDTAPPPAIDSPTAFSNPNRSPGQSSA